MVDGYRAMKGSVLICVANIHYTICLTVVYDLISVDIAFQPVHGAVINVVKRTARRL